MQALKLEERAQTNPKHSLYIFLSLLLILKEKIKAELKSVGSCFPAIPFHRNLLSFKILKQLPLIFSLSKNSQMYSHQFNY